MADQSGRCNLSTNRAAIFYQPGTCLYPEDALQRQTADGSLDVRTILYLLYFTQLVLLNGQRTDGKKRSL